MLLNPLLAAVEMKAELFIPDIAWLSNSLFVTLIVALLVIWFARTATRKLSAVPDAPAQNLFEGLVELLYSVLEEIVGKSMVARVLPFLCTVFIFIVTANWFGLVPGVGTIGTVASPEDLGPFRSAQEIAVPLLRPSNADLNMTFGLAAVFMFMWFYWTMRSVGIGNFLKHMFLPGPGLGKWMAILLAPIFFAVGLIEVVSTAFRPLSLSLRLYGNIFAGETLLHIMSTIGDATPPAIAFLLSVLAPLPFYFLEILVGLLQGLVFTLLCAVYIRLSTSHGDEEDHAH